MTTRKLKVVSAGSLEGPSIKWDRCCLCQASGGVLVCPAQNPVAKGRNKGYISLGANIERLVPYNYKMFECVDVKILNEGGGIINTFISREAKWHKSCALEFQKPRIDSLVLSLESERQRKLAAEAEAPSEPEPSEGPATRATRSSAPMVSAKEDRCFLCNESGNKETLHRVETKELCQKVASCAVTLKDERLNAYLAQGDLIALEARYHLSCLTRMYNKARRATCKSKADYDLVVCEGLAFADLITFIRLQLSDSRDRLFRMADLGQMYSNRLAQLLGEDPGNLPREHSSRLREKILAHLPHLISENTGKGYVLRHDKSLAIQAEREDQDEDALALYRFIKALRRSMSSTHVSFEGEFPQNCEEKSVPPMLLALVSLILYGSEERAQCRATLPAVTIAQLLLFNHRESMPKGSVVRARREKEPPLPMYLGLESYGRGREKAQIDDMHMRGLSVSSNRVMEVTSQLCRMVVMRADEEQVLCPASLSTDLFTVGAVDNIDFKCRSTTSLRDFHGTGISIFQTRLLEDVSKQRIFKTDFKSAERRGVRSVPALPQKFSQVPEIVLPEGDVSLSTAISSGTVQERMLAADSGDLWHAERDWLEHVQECMHEDNGQAELPNVSWSAYRAQRFQERKYQTAIKALLPLFDEKSISPGMVLHGMNIVSDIIKHLNGRQIPVLCGDQPIFAIIKLIQWKWPNEYGEDKFVAMLGPLHIEMVMLTILGKLMEGSGWTGVVDESGVMTRGSAEGILKASVVTKARLMHQKNAAVLHSLLVDAYNQSVTDGDVTLDEWISKVSKSSPTFFFWILVLNLEVLLLSFVRSLRTGDFYLYKEAIRNMLPWCFAFDRTHYCRWLSVHYKDLEELPMKAPDVNKEFESGKFVVSVRGRPFSAIGIDQAHEQNNKLLKGRGAAVGLTQDASKLNRIMLAGPEVSRLLTEFHEVHEANFNSNVHHEQKISFQKQFLDHCEALKSSYREHDNPFLIFGPDLLVLDTRVVMGQKAVKTLLALEESSFQAYQSFVRERLVLKTAPISHPITKMQTSIFTCKVKNKKVQKDNRLKGDIKIFWRLYNASLCRSLDLDVFFAHENQVCPPSLSCQGDLLTGDKADLVHKLEGESTRNLQPVSCDGVIFDGAALVHNIRPKASIKTFKDYYENQIKSHAKLLANKMKAKRVDFVWDLYTEPNIKRSTREARGAGTRKKDLPRKGRLPTDWSDYLRNSGNKTDLFGFLSSEILHDNLQFQVVTNVTEKIKSNQRGETSLSGKLCKTMEEADGRVIMHATDMVTHGAKSVLICASDTDVVVLAVSFFPLLRKAGLKELWLLYGSGKKRRFIAAHNIASALGDRRAEALRGFHAFTGCDTVSFFSGKKKKSAWNAWLESDELVTAAFAELGKVVPVIDENVLESLEKFTAKLFKSNVPFKGINGVRKTMFVSENRPLYLIPPTAAALHQHTLRAAYQAGVVWGRCLYPCEVPDPTAWGWQLRDGTWVPVWSTLPDVWEACRVLDTCGCKSKCETRRCACKAAGLPCIPACKVCKGDCFNASCREPVEAEAQDSQLQDPDDPDTI